MSTRNATASSTSKRPLVPNPAPRNGARRSAARVVGGTVVQRKSKRRSSKPRFTARTADRYELYQLSVQSTEIDIRVLTRVYRNEHGRPPLSLREDFCGTALMCADWVKSLRGRSAEGFDIDDEPIAWALERHLGDLAPERAAAVRIHLRDVRDPGHVRPDVRVALNFSYFAFQERATLLDYFKTARASLADGGMFVVDVHGGPEATEELDEKRKIDDGFTYMWEQPQFDPFSGHAVRHISFLFRDGTKLRRAFSYDWRMWTLPEVRDLLAEAGFRRVDVYAEGWDKNGKDGNGLFRLAKVGENCGSWVVYVVAWN
jgi:hypothetical protein